MEEEAEISEEKNGNQGIDLRELEWDERREGVKDEEGSCERRKESGTFFETKARTNIRVLSKL